LMMIHLVDLHQAFVVDFQIQTSTNVLVVSVILKRDSERVDNRIIYLNTFSPMNKCISS
jgi:hypothetical protein